MRKISRIKVGICAIICAFISSVSVAQVSPVICMPFEGNAYDISGNNHHGIVTGASLTFDRFGNPNSAFDFDGVDDQIQIADSLGAFHATNSLTIIFWAKTDSIGNNSPFLLLPNSNTERLNMHIYYDNSGVNSTFWDYGNISGGGRLYIPNVPFQSVWEHYAFIINETSDSMLVYRDGVLQGSKGNISSIFDRSRNLYIGGGISDVTNCYFNGRIDDVQIFDGALSQLEVLDNYLNSNTCLSSLQSYMKGKVYYDFNQNSVQDVGEPAYSSALLLELNTNRPFYSFSNGQFIFGIDSLGTFEIEPQISVPYYSSVPLSHTATFTSIGDVDSLNDFALQPTGSFDDLMVTINPLMPFRPGIQSGYSIYYKNIGTTTLSGEVKLVLDTLLEFDSAIDTPTVITVDTLFWNVGPLSPFQEGTIIVYATLEIGTPNGTSVSSSVTIDPTITDVDQYNNYSDWTLLSTGSYDPNDIAVNLEAIELTQVSNPPALTYLIRFQNTGTDTAFTVIVENVLPLELNDLSFELITSSHQVSLEYDQIERELRFIFNNILLPDSNTNEPLSHGSILYRIVPNINLGLGSQIISNANIYFDFNDPVLTNNAITTIVNTTSLFESTGKDNLFNLNPNPNNGNFKLTYMGDHSEKCKLEILDLNGRLLRSLNHDFSSEQYMDLDLSSIDQGTYLIQITSKSDRYYLRFVKYD